jgi:hypothetical protein
VIDMLRSLVLAALTSIALGGPAWACTDFARAPDSRWRIAWQGEVAWLATPCGERRLSLGVNVLDGGTSSSPPGPRAYRWADHDPSLEAWVVRARERLAAWGFDAAGGFSLPPNQLRMPTLPNLELGRTARYHWFDPFAPETEREVRRLAFELTAPHRGSPYRIGYTADNEVGWWNGALFNFYVRQPAGNHTKRKLIAFLERFYGADWLRLAADFVPPPGVGSFAQLLASEGRPLHLRPGGAGIQAVRHWTGVVTEHYYRLMAESLRAADPEAMFFGDRLPIFYDPLAVRSMARHVDAIAANYNLDAPDGWVSPFFFAGLRRLAPGRPVLVSEWFFAARENRSGNRNTGHLLTVATQAERARGAAAGARRLAQIPNVIGLHWFQFHDYPVGGRADSEDYNFGLVAIDDVAYGDLVRELGDANRSLASLHAVGAWPEAMAPAPIPFARISPGDGHLGDWPKLESWRPGTVASSGEVPFGDFYVSWSEQGLGLAVIAMDYFDPELLVRGAVPASEVFRVVWGVDGGAGAERFALEMVPPTTLPQRGAAAFGVRFCRLAGEACEEVPGATATYFGADQPRITVEILVPWRALGRDAAPERLKFYAGATAYHRSRWMAWGGGAPSSWLARPERWRDVVLQR